MLFDRLMIRQRMLALTLSGLGFVVLIGLVAYLAIERMDASTAALTRTNTALRSHMEADMMHDALRGDVLRAMLAAGKSEAKEQADIRKDFDEHVADFKKQIDELQKMALSPEITSALGRAQTGLNAYIASAGEIVALSFKDAAGAEARLPAFGQAFSALEDEMAKLSDLIEAESKATQEQAQATARNARWMLIGAALAATVLLLIVSVSVGRSITGPLEAAVRVTQSVAEGDLSQHIESTGRDETGQLLNALGRMNTDLGGIVSQVRSSAESITTGSTEIAAGSLNLSQRTEEQASSLQETAAAMDELTATVKNNADTARRAAQMADSAAGAATRGGETVGQVVQTMAAISSSSNKIGDIIGVIDGIAFQTNILALNAAVEAARAGEQGRGFAVVAGEVRSLAQRSAQAAREIKSLIGDSMGKVEAGSAQVAAAGASMEALVTEVGKVSQLIREIDNASHEQSQGISAVGQAVQQLDRMTQQNAALVEESAAAAESLQNQAETLAKAVAQFKLR
jgi:methyl-accepting chemotaxis protein